MIYALVLIMAVTTSNKTWLHIAKYVDGFESRCDDCGERTVMGRGHVADLADTCASLAWQL